MGGKGFLSIALSTTIVGCSIKSDHFSLTNSDTDKKNLKIITKILNKQQPGFADPFGSGSLLGLHAYPESKEDLSYYGTNSYNNIKVEAISPGYTKETGIEWKQTPSIRLNSKPMKFLAYYPYQPIYYFNPAKLPIQISPDASDTKNYMYGTQTAGHKDVTKRTPIVFLRMRHALSLLSFQVRLTSSAISGSISSVQINNKAGGTALMQRGTMNIRTGKITRLPGTVASTRLRFEQPVQLTSSPSPPMQIKVIPIEEIKNEGDVEALININGKSYTYKIPAKTEWRKGTICNYLFDFDGQSLTLNNESQTAW